MFQFLWGARKDNIDTVHPNTSAKFKVGDFVIIQTNDGRGIKGRVTSAYITGNKHAPFSYNVAVIDAAILNLAYECNAERHMVTFDGISEYLLSATESEIVVEPAFLKQK